MGDGPPRFPRGFTCPAVLGNEIGRRSAFAYRAVTFFGGAFQLASTDLPFCNSPSLLGLARTSPHNPDDATPLSLTRHRFGLIPVRSPLLRESLLLYFPEGTEMVHFPSLASMAYAFSHG